MDFGTACTLSEDEEFTSIAKKTTDKLTQRLGTSYFMAPEIVSGASYGYKIDVFSFSILTYEVLCDTVHPYGERGASDLNIDFSVSSDPNLRPSLEEAEAKGVPEWLVALMRLCWFAVPQMRPDFTAIRKILIAEGKDLKMSRRDGVAEDDLPVVSPRVPGGDREGGARLSFSGSLRGSASLSANRTSLKSRTQTDQMSTHLTYMRERCSQIEEEMTKARQEFLEKSSLLRTKISEFRN